MNDIRKTEESREGIVNGENSEDLTRLPEEHRVAFDALLASYKTEKDWGDTEEGWEDTEEDWEDLGGLLETRVDYRNLLRDLSKENNTGEDSENLKPIKDAIKAVGIKEGESERIQDLINEMMNELVENINKIHFSSILGLTDNIANEFNLNRGDLLLSLFDNVISDRNLSWMNVEDLKELKDTCGDKIDKEMMKGYLIAVIKGLRSSSGSGWDTSSQYKYGISKKQIKEFNEYAKINLGVELSDSEIDGVMLDANNGVRINIKNLEEKEGRELTNEEKKECFSQDIQDKNREWLEGGQVPDTRGIEPYLKYAKEMFDYMEEEHEISYSDKEKAKVFADVLATMRWYFDNLHFDDGADLQGEDMSFGEEIKLIHEITGLTLDRNGRLMA